MKKLISILLLAAMMLALLAPSFASAEETAWVKTGNGKGLNLREGPGRNYKVVRSIPYRTKVTVLQYNKTGWAEVVPVGLDGGTFWVDKSFLVYADPGPYKPDPKPTPTDDTLTTLNNAVKKIKYLEEPYDGVIITKRPTNYVHLRWFPSTSAAYIEQYLCDTEVTVIAEGGQWAQVQIGDYVGFILKANVSALYE